MLRRGALTLVAMVVTQPRRRKSPRIQHLLEAVDYQRFTAYDIVRATSYHPQSRMRCGVARAGNTSAAASWLQTAGIAESKLARAVAIVQGASVAAKGEPQSIRRRHGESYRDVDATEEPCSERRGSCHVLSGVSANAATFTFPTHSHQSG